MHYTLWSRVLVTLGHVKANFPLADPSWPCMIFNPVNALLRPRVLSTKFGSHRAFLSNLTPNWPRLTPTWPLTQGMHYTSAPEGFFPLNLVALATWLCQSSLTSGWSFTFWWGRFEKLTTNLGGSFTKDEKTFIFLAHSQPTFSLMRQRTVKRTARRNLNRPTFDENKNEIDFVLMENIFLIFFSRVRSVITWHVRSSMFTATFNMLSLVGLS